MNANQADTSGRERLLVIPSLEPAYLENLADDYDILQVDRGVGLTQMPSQRLSGIRAVLTSGPVGFTREMFEACPDIEVVVTFGTGKDRVDMDCVRRRGVFLASGKGANAPCVAEHALALLLGIVRELPHLHANVVAGKWRPDGTRRQISGKRLGLIGLGGIGLEVARMAEGLRMEVGYTARHRRSDQPYRYFDNARDLAAFADALILACPGGLSAPSPSSGIGPPDRCSGRSLRRR